MRFYYNKIIGNRGEYIIHQDWDNLIILDACRLDFFNKNNNVKGKFEFRISRGSCTSQFLKENFSEKSLNDTIYITANPLVNYHVPNSFYKIVPVWGEGWSNEYETVLPSTMCKYAIDVNDSYPNKKLIIHFMQPHYPFIGRKGLKEIGVHDGIKSRNYFIKNKDPYHTELVIWNLVKEKKVTKKIVLEAYEENLRIVLVFVEKLLKILHGKTIITSDHGELFGEWILPFPIKGYGHPGGIYCKKLIKVPWLIYNNGERKTITLGNDSEKEKIKREIKKLKHLI